MVTKELVRIGLDCDSAESAIRTLAEAFVQNGVAKESFVEAVVEREKVYPTGLPAEAFDIAIPHTVSEHVIQPAMAVGVLKHPVEFSQMGTPEIKLQPRLLFMLAIKDPKEQIGLLRKIMKLIQDTDLLQKVVAAQSEDEVVDLLLPAL